MARKFFYVCAGLFLLVGAYALGAINAGAQGGESTVAGVAVMSDGSIVVCTVNGDLYERKRELRGHGKFRDTATFAGNIWKKPPN